LPATDWKKKRLGLIVSERDMDELWNCLLMDKVLY